MFVEELGSGMRIPKGLDIHGVEKSASLNRLSVPIIAPGNMSASCNGGPKYSLHSPAVKTMSCCCLINYVRVLNPLT